MKGRNASLVAVVVTVLCVSSTMVAVHADVLRHGLKIEQVLDNTEELGNLAVSPAGELWLLERSGTVRVIVAGTEQASLTLSVSTACESGLLDVAFAPDYVSSGSAFLYYIDDTGKARVDQVFRDAVGMHAGGEILDLGVTAGGCRPGGGLEIGADEKLYVSVGDLEISANGQDDGTLPGKVLRAELDGSVPVDNPSGTLVWAKGFRNGKDLELSPGGMVYVNDLGAEGAVSDEINAVHQGGNYGWDQADGDTGGVFDDPLISDMPTVQPEAMVRVSEGLGDENQDSLVYACMDTDEMRQAVLTGADFDELEEERGFYDPLADGDGTPDAGCPKDFNALAEGPDGWLYGANTGDNPGIWRVWHDLPGPREVSAPGSPFGLTIDKSGDDIVVGWENLTVLDAVRPSRNAGQHSRSYQIWEGTLPIDGSYDHAPVANTNGVSVGPSRRTETVSPGAGDRYYVVSAQGDNLEGSLGRASDGSERPGQEDYCETIGYGKNVNQCAMRWTNPLTGEELKLIDYNPNSATYLQELGMSDFRGKVLRMDISAYNCVFCNAQADVIATIEGDYRARDFEAVTLMTYTYQALNAIPPGSCGVIIGNWVNAHGVTGPILCDVDLNADGKGDATWQYWNFACGGTPENYYIDQGHSIYNFVCGAELSSPPIVSKISGEINPESCE